MHTTVAGYKRKSIICTLILTYYCGTFVTKDPSFQHENIGVKASRLGPQSDWAIKRINTEETFGELVFVLQTINR
jgi:hypothetical protein